MIEKFKSFLLAVLVILSLYLTYLLWYGEKPYEPIREEIYEQVFFKEPRPLSEAISPARILLLIGDAPYLLPRGGRHFRDAWQSVSLTLQQQSSYEYRAVEALAGRPPCLKIDFSPFLPVGAETPWLKDDRYRELEEIYFWRVDGQIWAALEEPGETAQTLLVLPSELALSLQNLQEVLQADLAEGDAHLYRLLSAELLPPELSAQLSIEEELFVPMITPIMEAVNLEAEKLDRERFLDTLFVNRSLVRLIHEKDGAVIYTDGEKGLRIGGEGLEYWDPRQQRRLVTLSYLAALNAANRFISNSGGWPAGLRLESLALVQGATFRSPLPSFRAEWMLYYEGYPITGGPAAAAVTLNDGGVLHYQRLIYHPVAAAGEEYKAAPAEKVLEAALLLFRQEKEEDPAGTGEMVALEALDLVYVVTGLLTQPQALPVWSVRLNGMTFLLHVRDLAPIQSMEAGL